MAMSPGEVVRAAIRFETPDRLPVQIEALGYSDILNISLQLDCERLRTGYGLDEWGCQWGRTEVQNMGQVVTHPMTEYSMVEDYPFPDPNDDFVLNVVAEALKEPDAEIKYVNVSQFMVLFERMHSLMGMVETLEGLYLEPEAMGLLADRIVDYDIAKLNRLGEAFGSRIHGYGGTDDWGTQQALFVNPELWRTFFMPRYARIWEAVHAWGWDARLHSCGKVNEAVEMMIEAGLDDINLQQPRALGIDEMAARYAGRICFTSLCDIQHTLPTHDTELVYAEARELLEKWAVPAGGFILSDYGDGEAIGVPDTVKHAMFDAFTAADPFSRASGVQGPALAAAGS